VAQLAVPPAPAAQVAAAMAPRPEWRTGQPKSPWRVRKEQEAREAAELEQRILTAIQEGRGQEVLAAAEIALARVHFSTFCRLAWHVLEPSTYLDWGRHHELICTVLQALFEDWWRSKLDRNYFPHVRNTVFNCPPGSLKSKLIAVLFQAWVWIRAPGTKFICVSVNELAALRDARDTRLLMSSDWYRINFQPNWTIKDDQDAISDFGNTAGGARLSRPSGSTIIGLRGDFFLGDDLNDPEKAGEKSERDKVNSTWDNNQYKRVNDELRSQRICVQQRVHVEDHTGHVLKKQGTWSPENKTGWLHVVLPAEFEVKRGAFELPVKLRKYVRDLPGAELRDWRKVEGEILHPARMTPDYLVEEKKRCAGTSNYACQMQQRPVDQAGGKIKRESFGFFRLRGGVRDDVDEHDTGRSRPDGCEKAETIIIEPAHYRPGYWDFDLVGLSVDPALKKTDRGSRWGMLAFGVKGGRRFILDDKSQRGEPDMAIKVLLELTLLWKPEKMLIENKAGGEGLRRNLEIAMANGDFPMVEIVMVNPGTQDKDARLNSASPTIANGMLFLREGAEWLEDYVEELAMYPNFSTDDRVDATTQLINEISMDDCAYPSAGAWNVAAGLQVAGPPKQRAAA
jgi:predicted phage terminase large subunit-like protein